MTPRKVLTVGAITLIAGLAILAPFAYFWNQNRIALASPAAKIEIPIEAPVPEPTPTLITGKPIQLLIPSLGIDLQVADGALNEKNSTWTLSRDKAHYALPTVQPNNESGNTLIYGHYRPEVFASLRKIQPGAEVTVIADNGHRFTYTFREAQKVAPTDVSIFAYQGKPQLTLQTCTGIYMQDRHLFYFDLKATE